MREVDLTKCYQGKPCKSCRATLRRISNDACVACARKASNRYFEKNRDRYAQYRLDNAEARKDYSRQWYYDNREKALETRLQYARTHPEIVRPISRRNRHRRRSAVSIPYSKAELQARFTLFGDRCVYCGACDNITVDHFFPLGLGGIDALHNLVPACHSCNSSKGDSEPVQWMQGKGYSDRHITTLASLVLELAKNA